MYKNTLRISVFLCLVFFTLFSSQLRAQGSPASLNVSLVGHLAYNNNLSDVWGYVDSNGREYALVGAVDGVSIVDLINPSQPTELHFMPGVVTTWRDLKVWDQYCYVTNEGGDGLRVIDLSGLPGSVSYVDTVLTNFTTAHNIYIDSAGYAYVVGGNFNLGMAIYDLKTDPFNPTLVSTWNQNYVHDIYVRDTLAYASLPYVGELAILSVADPANPTLLGTVNYPNAFTHNAWLSDDGTHCFTTDEVDFGYITSWDVSDPSNIQFKDHIRSSLSGGTASPHNAHTYNDYLVTSYYSDGLHITDASRPHNLVEVGYYDTSPNTGGGFLGAWGAYPYLPSGLVLCTDMTEGLFVLQANYKRGAYLEGVARNDNNSAPLPNVDVSLTGGSFSETTSFTGEYAIGIADSGSFTATASLFGFQSVDTTVVMAPGQLILWNPRLVPSPQVNFSLRVEDALTGLPIPNAEVRATSQGYEFNFSTDANGLVNNSTFTSANYDLIAGKWGYVTNGTTTTVDSSSGLIVIALTPGYYDDFSFDYNWTISGNSGTGIWERGVPNPTYYFGFLVTPELDATDDFGNRCYVTGNLGGELGDDEVGFGYTEMVSPVMDLSNYNEPWIVFDWWHLCSMGSGAPGFRDSLVVEVDNGIEKKRVWFVRDLQTLAWERDSIRISDHLQPTSTVQVHIRSSDRLNANFVESAIDRFWIWNDPTVSTQKPLPELGLTAWPNPAVDRLHIAFDPVSWEGGEIALVDLNGKVLSATPLSSGQTSHELSIHLPAGVYMLQLKNGANRQVTRIAVQ